MAAERKTIAEKPDDDEKWEQLFQKTIEAIDLFGERPDSLSGFVNALRTREFPRAQRPLELRPEQRTDDRAATTGEVRTFPRQRSA
jgi:hypothetical protein